MAPHQDLRQDKSPISFGWLSGPGGVHLHPAVTGRFGQEGLIRIGESANREFDGRFGSGLRMWCDANWLRQVWIEIYASTDANWSPEWWSQPRAHVFDGDLLILPVAYGLPALPGFDEGDLIKDLVRRAPGVIDEAAKRRGWGQVPWDGVLPPGGIVTKRRPMSDATRAWALARLWKVLDDAGAAPDRPAEELLPDVAEVLYRSGRKACTEFLTGMHLALFDLDREVLCRQPVRDRGEGTDRPPIPLSNDTFLYVRCAVLLSGRAEFDAVLVDP